MNKKAGFIADKYECYFTPAAKRAVDNLIKLYGLDKDLAVSLIENSWPEDELYTLEDRHEI